MSDTEKLAEAMKELASALRLVADKIPQSGLSGFTVWHQHTYPADMNNRQSIPPVTLYERPYYTACGGTTY